MSIGLKVSCSQALTCATASAAAMVCVVMSCVAVHQIVMPCVDVDDMVELWFASYRILLYLEY
jgi:hypothetical protein